MLSRLHKICGQNTKQRKKVLYDYFAGNLVAICIGAILGKSIRERDLYNIFFSMAASIGYVAFIAMCE